ncbi:cysteine desulfurase family protein [Oribacterium sp. WCC10]|uniref:cysteine desulfurase family protein n=1 Tax=Oribacterium sp. WCC10 TaxID=1855343 RepID=UPI000B828341|nr:cysteine desulfurase family protein [Oribacterium sp. WCC10]
MKDYYYMDNAATTPLSKEAFEAMMPFLTDDFGNASAIYTIGQHAKSAIEKSRRTIAATIGAKPSEIYFTSGGSESDNWALVGSKEIYDSLHQSSKKTAYTDSQPKLYSDTTSEKSNPGHIITTGIEHHAILNTCEYLEAKGVDITYLDVDKNGLVNPDDVFAAIRPDTFLVSIMTANNEVGTLQPIKEIGERLRDFRKESGQQILFHSDAVQAYGHIPISVEELNLDLMSVSAHKLNGPKGIGFLFVRRGVLLPSFIHGGAQERGKRAGTENVSAVVGFAKAAELACANMNETAEKELSIRNHMIERLTTEIADTTLNGDISRRLPNNINVSFRDIDSETLLLLLNERNIYASAGSACASGSLEPSHVLSAIGLDNKAAKSSLRLTISKDTSLDDADHVVDVLKELVERLR